MPKSWMNTISRDHVRLGVEGGFTQAGHGKASGLKRLSAGDWIVFYSPKTSLRDGEPLQAFTAIGRVADDELYQVEMAPGFVPWRRNVEFLGCKEAPIKPLTGELSFIKDKQRWGYVFRFGLFEIPARDFDLIRRAMDADLDSYLDSVLIGGRETRAVTITDFDPAWPERYEAERERIATALGPRARRIEHIGSTSVPGLAAKPIVDILVTVDDPEDDAEFCAALEAAGYVLRVREPAHRMFRTPARTVQIHVWADSDSEVQRYLAFRDRLRGSTELRDAYEQLKRDLAAREWTDVNHYAEAKGPFIRRALDQGS
jgi:GrpB-like predicted nucleotidyltransferase (UPF0157 family)